MTDDEARLSAWAIGQAAEWYRSLLWVPTLARWEDCEQEVRIALWAEHSEYSKYRNKFNYSTFARNTAIWSAKRYVASTSNMTYGTYWKNIQKAKRLEPLLYEAKPHQDQAEDLGNYGDTVCSHFECEQLRRTLNRLTKQQRYVIARWAREETLKSIAKDMGCSQGRVSQILKKAKSELLRMAPWNYSDRKELSMFKPTKAYIRELPVR